ncbi:MAG: thymidylate synthase [Patescibacteria group bacterium]|nr:thymidylate synthase [Patescibacteria group bacterium]
MKKIKNANWPAYKNKMLIVGNKKSQVAVCTLWTKKEMVGQILDLKTVAVIGNLYSPKKGVSFLIRNILANPNIRYLIVCGLDNSKSGQVLIDFSNNGFKGITDEKNNLLYWQVISETENKIDTEIEREAIELFREKVKIIDLRNERNFKEIQEKINFLDQNLPPFSCEPLIFPDEKKDTVESFPSEDSVHTIRGKKIAETWLKILDHILRFGRTDQTSYQNQQKEIIDIVSVITDEDPENLYIPEWLPNDAEHMKEYAPTVLSAFCPQGAAYTYGSRMRSYFGVDQIQEVINRIREEKHTRRAMVNLLDPRVDSYSKNPPCLNHCWFRVQGDKLHLVATLRSNDMFDAWPENALALRLLQNIVFKKIVKSYSEVKLGNLVIHSLSAHIYDDSWKEAKKIVEQHHKAVFPSANLEQDCRGNFIITVENSEIVVEHYSSNETLLATYRNKKAMPIYFEMSRNGAVSVISHALYIGTELQKAELAIKLMLPYKQDIELNINKLKI